MPIIHTSLYYILLQMKCFIAAVICLVMVVFCYAAPSNNNNIDDSLSPVDVNESFGPTVHRHARQFFGDSSNTNVDVSQQSGGFQDYGFGGAVDGSFQNTDIDVSQQNVGGVLF